jgi:Ca2+-binding RTX toxin-like protein
VTLGVRAATVRAVGGCASGAPALAGVSEVAGLTLNGNELPLAQAEAQLNTLLAPLGQVVDLKLDEQVRSGSRLTQRALHLRVLSGAGSALIDVVVGEARAGADGAVCSASGGGGDDDRAAGGGATQATAVCPTGSTLDASSGRCVIRETTATGAAGATIAVGRPFEGPVGGTVMSLAEARKRYRSTCLRGRGASFVVVGTARSDRVTGTNQDDRMLLLGGGDRGDGGRGADCVDGGTGRDVLSGSQDKDRVYGGAGNDSLNGGPAKDRLSGGKGNDTINAAYGADATFGGGGRDSINIATAGPRASASCGAGRDTVRLNGSERRRLRACERRLVLPDR